MKPLSETQASETATASTTGPNPKVLVVEDEPALLDTLEYNLTKQGYTVVLAKDGLTALTVARQNKPDLILLDVMLPGMDGFEVCRILRQEMSVPILILTAKAEEVDKVVGLEVGADDYLTKPFGLSELLARVRVALRRSARHESEPVFVCGDLRVDPQARSVHRGEQALALTATEFNLLQVLVRHAGKPLTHRQLLREVWGPESDLHTLRVNVSNLRRKLEPDPAHPRYLVTEPGVGYRLQFLTEP